MKSKSEIVNMLCEYWSKLPAGISYMKNHYILNLNIEKKTSFKDYK